MKKNKMMRLASALMVMTLLTTSIISGTFAKYVTEAEGSDSARVAKFGVVLSIADNSTFQTEYATDDTDYTGELSVQAYNGADKLVAPGTTGSVDFSITGTPEVAVKIAVGFEEDYEEVYLKAGTYTDWTKAPYGDTFEITEDYYPIVWTLSQTKNADGAYDTPKVIETGTLADINEALSKYSSTATYVPNTDLEAAFTLSWEWAFEGNDKADTLLGNLAADETTYVEGIEEDAYNLTTSYNLKVTVTQID